MNRARHYLRLMLVVVVSASVHERAHARESIILATTTSTRDSGLLDVLVPRFERQSGVRVKVIAVGTGAALRMASTGDADVVLVHSPAAEKAYLDAGDLIDGRRVMYNDFVIVGPPEDPAGVGAQESAAAAMRAIAERGTFISRGDESGTHAQELTLWRSANLDPRAIRRREETGLGMGATLHIADQKRAYTLADRGTYLSLRKRLGLAILYRSEPSLRNVYHVYVVNPGKHKNVRAAGARAFTAFVVSLPVQRAIGEFKRQEHGEPIFYPDAIPGTGMESPRK